MEKLNSMLVVGPLLFYWCLFNHMCLDLALICNVKVRDMEVKGMFLLVEF